MRQTRAVAFKRPALAGTDIPTELPLQLVRAVRKYFKPLLHCLCTDERCCCGCLLVLKGEKLEDEIIEIATVLREKADEMVAETGAINFEIIQPMIDEIAVLKSKYK